MRFLIERYRYLYVQGEVPIEYFNKKLEEGKITQEEYNYIIGK